MRPASSSSGNPFQHFFQQAFRTFNISPITDWRRFYNPQFFISYNVGDIDLENHILSEAGSYGKQIGVLLKAVDVLLARLSDDELTPRELVAKHDFRSLLASVTAAKEQFRGHATREVTRSDVEDLLARVRDLKTERPDAYEELIQRLRAAVNSADDASGRAGR